MPTKILLVEDDPSLARLIDIQLSRFGYEVKAVPDGESALAFVQRQIPDVVLLDIVMPGIGGIETCRRMREDERLSSTPIIMLTSLTQIVDKRKGFEVGADDYLTKPSDPDELKLRIDSHLRRVERLSVDGQKTAGDTPPQNLWTQPMAHKNQVKAGPTSSFLGEGPRVSVVIPTLNEAENLPDVLPWIPDWVHEVILVDGFSTDGTVEVALSLRPDIKIVIHKKKGKGTALQAGFAAATGDIIVMLDADGSTDPAEIPAFVGTLLGGADFAKGSRFLQGGGTTDMPIHRKLGNMFFVLVVRLLFGGTYSDLLYGYNAFWAHVLPLINVDAPGFEIETLMNIRALRGNIKISEVPSIESARLYGTAKLVAIPDGWRVLQMIFREYWDYRIRQNDLSRRGMVDKDRVFVPAVGKLFRDALHLWRSHDQMDPEYYRSALGAIKEAYLNLLDTESRHADDRAMQNYYRTHYQERLPWAFAEEIAGTTGKMEIPAARVRQTERVE